MQTVKEEIVVKGSDVDKFMTFTLGNQTFAIEIDYVIEIIGLQKITPFPKAKHYVKGMINLRGKIIPLLDMRLYFDMEEKPYNDRTCVIVVSANDNLIGFIVDSVSEVISIPDENISEPPNIKSAGETEHLKGIGKIDGNVALILNFHELITSSNFIN